jgi:hypothetical protein
MAVHDKLLWCPPAIARLCLLLLGFALFMAVSLTLQPKRSLATQTTPGAPGGALALDGRAAQTSTDATGVSSNRPPLIDHARATANALSPADLDKIATTIAQVVPPLTDSGGRPLLGSLVGSQFNIWIYAGTEQPLYTVADAKGRAVVEGLIATEVFARFPQIPLTELRLQQYHPSTGLPLMYVDPGR